MGKNSSIQLPDGSNLITKIRSRPVHQQQQAGDVLKSIEQLRYGIIAELTTGYKEADKREAAIVNGCFNKFIKELRQSAEEPKQ